MPFQACSFIFSSMSFGWNHTVGSLAHLAFFFFFFIYYVAFEVHLLIVSVICSSLVLSRIPLCVCPPICLSLPEMREPLDYDQCLTITNKVARDIHI